MSHPKGFPLWGKLSPKVTDEGENCCCRTFAPHPARTAPPSPGGGRLFCGRGGACPARDKTAARNLRVIRRGGIYAARCSQTGNATHRANGTGRIYASPTNLPEIGALPITAYLPPKGKVFSHKKRAARRAAHRILTLNSQLYTLHNYGVLHHPKRNLRPAEAQFVHAVGVVLVRRARVGAQNTQ